MLGHYINNKFLKPSPKASTFVVDNPATGETIAVLPKAGRREVNLAVASATAAALDWRRLSASDKAEMLHEASRKMRRHASTLIELLTLEQGKPHLENEEEVVWSYNTFDYYAELGRHSRGRVLPSTEYGVLNMVIKEPYGVVGCIVPWNYPLLLLAWKLAPALAAGNTVVIKPSELTPLPTLSLCEVAFDHFPAGVVNVVLGDGSAGEALVRHPDVPMIAFTGSLATGQKIASHAAPRMKKVHLELGGKDAFVIADDADPRLAAKAVAYAGLINAGQVCTSTERIYVSARIAKPFTVALVDLVRGLKIGAGADPTTDIGPMIGTRYREKTVRHLADAKRRGTRVLAGGKVVQGRGYFHQPTVLVGCDHTMKIMTEETFGPALPIMTYRTFDEAIALANDCIYGLGACLYTSDAKKVHAFYENVKAGTIWINDPLTDNYAGPFGGMKYTGGGRELGEEGLDEFRETKHVHWDIEAKPKSWWLPYGRP